jgi:Ca2+-binding EF-hand superfamily protein
MSHTDWLDVYSKSIKEYDLDMDHLIRSTREPDQYHEDMEAGKLLKEDWKKMADYAQFISGVQKASGKKDNYEKLIQFMAKHDQDGDGVTRESIFRGVIKSQY